MTREEEIVKFLKNQRGKDFCDSCLSEKLLPKPVGHAHMRTVTSTLGLTKEYKRREGVCQHCGKTTNLVIRFV